MNKTATSFLLPAILILANHTHAGSATWNVNPTSNDWNTPTNWTPATVPNGLFDTATFAFSNTTDISISSLTTVGGIVFNPGAGAYTLGAPISGFLEVEGAGVINNSGHIQTINIAGQAGSVSFFNSSTAGDMMLYSAAFNFFGTSNAGSGSFTLINTASVFLDQSSASSSNFTIPEGLFLQFRGSSNGGSAAFSLQAVTNAFNSGGALFFEESSSAANSTITAEGTDVVNINGRTLVDFSDTSDASTATIIALSGSNGGAGGNIDLEEQSTGTPRIELFGNGQLDISAHKSPGTTVGSIEGDGRIFLGQQRLTVGDSLNTTFSGIIQDGGIAGGTGGDLMKVGSSTLTLVGASTYTGETTVTEGTLLVSNQTGSGTGTGNVQVNTGSLGGSGIVSGAVVVGTNSGAGAVLAPAAGSDTHQTFTTQSRLILEADATYRCTATARGRQVRTDKVVANEVTIAGARFFPRISGTLQAGTVFTVISNTSANPIAGSFSNLQDGGIIKAGGNRLQASYEGGDGNDLTLTVVP